LYNNINLKKKLIYPKKKKIIKMKTTIAFVTFSALATKVFATCFSEKLGYPCCVNNSQVIYTDSDGKWGMQDGDWCGLGGKPSGNCFSVKFGWSCCSGNNKEVVYTDKDGKWGIENGGWCGIGGNGTPTTKVVPTTAKSQPTYPYMLKNDPVKSSGCGKNPSLPKNGSFDFNSSAGRRKVFVDVPDNYDNSKPYRLIFGMMCMGGSASNVHNENYYGLRPLDTGKTTIFVAPEGNGQMLPWGQADYKLFDELLAKLKSEYCIDVSRVFSTGFSYGAMFTNGLSWDHQKDLRAVAVYETAERNIWLPKNTGLPIGWMGVLGFDDTTCTPEMGRNARDIILKNNYKKGASNERAQEANRGGAHLCYDYKNVDENFPVRWCTQSGGHMWDHKDPGQWQSWVPKATWEFFAQF